jgi:hypothetical protein
MRLARGINRHPLSFLLFFLNNKISRKNDMHRLTAVDGLQRGLLLPRDTAPIARLQGQSGQLLD